MSPLNLRRRIQEKKLRSGRWLTGLRDRLYAYFFGPTPVSPSPSNMRAYSPVNVIGRLITDPLVLKRVKPGEKIKITTLLTD